MQRSSMIVARISVGLGFLLVGLAPLPLAFTIGYVRGAANQYTFWIASAVGFTLLGAASSIWLRQMAKADRLDPGMRLPLWIFSLGCVVLGVAYLGFLNELRQIYASTHHFAQDRRQLLDYSVSLFGFWLTAFGFWLAGHTVKSSVDDTH